MKMMHAEFQAISTNILDSIFFFRRIFLNIFLYKLNPKILDFASQIKKIQFQLKKIT